MADKTPIDKEQLDLTEAELNKIFFGSDSIVVEPTENTNPVPVKPISTGKPKKLQRKNAPLISSDTSPEDDRPADSPIVKEEPKPVEPPAEPEKKPWGRPKKWTPEKIEALKAQQKAESLQKKAERDAKNKQDKLAQADIHEPLSNRATERLLETIITSKQEVEKLISEKRETIKGIVKNNGANTNLYKRSQCEDHLFKFVHFTQSGLAATCKKCSTQKEFTTHEWTVYTQKNRSRL